MDIYRTSIYNQNKDSIVIIDSASQGGMPTGSASGFYIRSGVVVTSYDSIYRMIENGAVRYYAVDSNDKITEIEGIISVYPEINIAILKLKEDNVAVFFCDIYNSNNKPHYGCTRSLLKRKLNSRLVKK